MLPRQQTTINDHKELRPQPNCCIPPLEHRTTFGVLLTLVCLLHVCQDTRRSYGLDISTVAFRFSSTILVSGIWKRSVLGLVWVWGRD